MKFVDLFAGIGGFSLGLERIGMVCVGQVEIDSYCNAVLKKYWPHVKRIRDIREVCGDEFGTVELICGGFPCQPFSLAGQRGGKEDDRYLWPEMLRVIKAARPTWVLGENVAGIIGVELDKVLSDLEGVGFEVQAFVIPACAVDAPHRRDRVWIVAYNDTAIRDKPERQQGVLADATCKLRDGFGDTRPRGRTESTDSSRDMANAEEPRLETRGQSSRSPGTFEAVREMAFSRFERCGCSRWLPEPNVGRVAHGISRRVDRLRALGNAVVPQVVELIGRAIMCCEKKP